jgi:hypothetical protein
MNTPHAQSSPTQAKSYSIIVNGRPREVSEHRLSYIQVVQLAYPGEMPTDQIVFTVTYAHPHGRDGTMVAGQEVQIKDGMVFNVRKTDKS